jgi:hypothetical protein
MLAKDFNGAIAATAAFARSDDAIDLSGAGIGFTDENDAANFVYEELIGDFDIQVQLKSFDVSDYLSSAGLIARASLAPGALSVAALWRPIGFETLGTTPISGFSKVVYARTNSGAARPIVAGGFASALTWLRLQRLGDEIRVLSSNDGQSYSELKQSPPISRTKCSSASPPPPGSQAAPLRTRNFAVTRSASPSSLRIRSHKESLLAAARSSPLTYQWFRNNTPIAGQNQSTLRIPSVSVADAGQYYVILNSIAKSAMAALDIGGLASGIKGDVAPRANGDGNVGVSEWVQTARFVVKLDAPSSSEVYRAATAPRSTGGDGLPTVMDAQTCSIVHSFGHSTLQRSTGCNFAFGRTESNFFALRTCWMLKQQVGGVFGHAFESLFQRAECFKGPLRNATKSVADRSSPGRLTAGFGADVQGGRFGAGMNVEFGEDSVEIVAGGFWGETQRSRGFFVGFALRDVGQEAAFLEGKRVQGPGIQGRAGMACLGFRNAFHHRGIQNGFAAGHFANGVHQPHGVVLFEKITIRAGFQRGKNRGPIDKRSDHQNADVRKQRFELPTQVDSALAS